MDELPVEIFVDAYPPPIRDATYLLRRSLRELVPDAVEGVRIGWRAIGYTVAGTRRRPKLFALIGPEPKHVHLFFHYGIYLADPDRVLRGAHLKLRRVRYLTFTSPGEIEAFPRATLARFVRDAAELAPLSDEQRRALVVEPS